MPSIRNLLKVAAVGFATVASALPALPKLSERSVARFNLATRQNALAAAAGITDIDILQL
jgi:hypothetical protein